MQEEQVEMPFPLTAKKRAPLELKLRVLSAVDYAPGNSIRARIKHVAGRQFIDAQTGQSYQFTWRTISTWLYRFKKHSVIALDSKCPRAPSLPSAFTLTRTDKNAYRKVQPNELAEAIHEILPGLSHNKTGIIPKSTLYRRLLDKNFFQRSQLSQTSFYRMVRENNLLDTAQCKKLRRSFAMQFANELWQADTMYGPAIAQADGKWRKTFLIAFIDDASRVITHGEFFYRDNTENMIDAFRSALFKRGKPERLYFDNGSNYTSKEILQACVRLDIRLTHAPVRDGAAKGKIERFFRGFRDRFLTQHTGFASLADLNDKTQAWIEDEYNAKYHAGIQMIPIDRFNLDHAKLQFLTDDEYTEEVFFIEVDRKVSKTNVFSINAQHGGFSVVIGPPGVGKTVLREHLEALAKDRDSVVVSCSRTMHTYLKLIQQLAESLKIEAPTKDLEQALIQTAFTHVRERKTLYTLIDEAHLLDMAVLRKLRLLFERFPKKHNLVLFGQRDLLYYLSMNINEDIKSRITYSETLYPLSDQGLEVYIQDELNAVRMGANTFDTAATELIVRSVQGNLRLCRNLCYGSLIEACRENKKIVTLTHVNNVLVQPHWRSHEELIKQQAD